MNLADYDSKKCVTETHGSEIAALARKAMQVLATQKTTAPKAINDRLEVLCDAFLDNDGTRYETTIRQILDENITPAEILDHIIPSISRLIGEKWCSDEVSFVDSTIAGMRMQETVRALLALLPREIDNPLGKILLIIPSSEDHSLGAMIVANQFKRHGYDVDLVAGRQVLQIAELVGKANYDLVGLTAARRKTLVQVKKLAEMIRGCVLRPIPIVVGGPVVQSGIDVQGITGADHVACDVPQVLKLCKLASKLSFDAETDQAE